MARIIRLALALSLGMTALFAISGAAADAFPVPPVPAVTATNLLDRSFSIVFTTRSPETTYSALVFQGGCEATNVTSVGGSVSADLGNGLTHAFTVSGLQPATSYTYQIFASQGAYFLRTTLATGR